MRILILMRGLPGSGKSTFIREEGLENYTLSADTIRLLYSSPSLNIDNKLDITQDNDNRVWITLFDMLETRMKTGEFTIVDATHSTAKSINQYRKLASEYKYKVWVVDMSYIGKKEARKRNRDREEYKVVPDDVISKMDKNLEERIPGWVSVTNPLDFNRDIKVSPIDLSSYKQINHIGDIHGCYTVLREYISEIKDDEFYIFLGDYIDRGLENIDVVNFLISIKEKKNVLILEGNHEHHISRWSADKKAYSKSFNAITALELDDSDLSKKKVRQLYRRMPQMAYYKYGDKEILATHGGMPSIPEDLHLINTKSFIKGVGSYKDDIDKVFNDNAANYQYQIHGHRNIPGLPIRNGNSFNLEGRVEKGGNLRIVELNEFGFNEVEIENKVYDKEYDYIIKDIKPEIKDLEFLELLRRSKDIVERKQTSNISSFNFSRDVFYNNSWNNINTKARGLFINTNTAKIVNRGYDKFFNLNQISKTEVENIKHLNFPLTVNRKYNGFLGLLGYNAETNELVYSSKSLIDGDHADMFKRMFKQKTEKEIRELKKYLREEKVSLTFEVIQPALDPHIIKYKRPNMVLLDIVDLSPIFSKKSYREVGKVADMFNFAYKEQEKAINSYDEFISWYEKISNDYDCKIEGWVIEDAKGFMFKVKSPYYNLWKKMRGEKDRVTKGRKISIENMDEKEREILRWMFEQDKIFLGNNIIIIRDAFNKDIRMKKKLDMQNRASSS